MAKLILRNATITSEDGLYCVCNLEYISTDMVSISDFPRELDTEDIQQLTTNHMSPSTKRKSNKKTKSIKKHDDKEAKKPTHISAINQLELSETDD